VKKGRKGGPGGVIIRGDVYSDDAEGKKKKGEGRLLLFFRYNKKERREAFSPGEGRRGGGFELSCRSGVDKREEA